jgi:preprotein translocase subunit SecG
MANVLIVAYLLIVLALIAVILLQRSEGGGLGMGGGGGGLMTARGSSNLLTRTTAVLAVLFFATAIGLTVISDVDRGTRSILDAAGGAEDGAAPTSVLDALNRMQGESGGLPVPAAPANEPVAPADELAPPADSGLALPGAADETPAAPAN